MSEHASDGTRLNAALRGFFGVPFRAQTYRNLAYLALAFPLGLAYFVGVTTGLSTGVGMAVTLVGVPLILITLVVAAGIGNVESKLATWLLGTEVTPPAVLDRLAEEDLGTTDGLVGAATELLTAPSTWLSLVLVGVKFLFGVLAFSALVTAGSVVVALLSMPAFYDVAGVTYSLGPYPVETFDRAVVGGALGVIGVFIGLHLLNGLARLGGFLTAALLGTPDGDAWGGDDA